MPRFPCHLTLLTCLPVSDGIQMLDALRIVHQETGRIWSLFGDSAFGLNIHLQRMLRGAAARSDAGRQFNRRMASVRISIENAFAEVLNRWRFVGVKRLHVLGTMPCAKHVHVAVLFHNLYGICYGSQAANMFGQHLRAGLTMHTFLAKRHTN